MNDPIVIILIIYVIVMLLPILLFLYTIGMTPKNINHRINGILDKWFDGHISFRNITIYGRNAMRWKVNIRTKKWGCICFNLPIPIEGKIEKFYFYLSPNGTPWVSTYYIGKDIEVKNISKLRNQAFGHNFDTDYYRDELRYINDTGNLPQRILRENSINELLNDKN